MSKIIDGKFTDAIRVTKHGEIVENYQVIDMNNDESPHRDAIQIIPSYETGFNTQFAAAMIEDVIIRNNVIKSNGKLQGIFCSDGLIKNISITGNVIDTNSYHKITLNGLLSGHITRNKNSDGELVQVIANPLRIGGNSDGLYNVWVVGFSDEKYEYKPITGQPITDNRKLIKDNGDVYLTNFDLEGFINECRQIP